jgi:hypothetical protein
MATRSSARQQGHVNGPKWSKNNTSDFDPDPSGSSALSSSDDPAVSDDLDLYEPVCVFQLPIESHGLKYNISSKDATLTDEQINALNGRLDEFCAADHITRERITQEFCGSFRSAWPQGERKKFDETLVITVRAPTAT